MTQPNRPATDFLNEAVEIAISAYDDAYAAEYASTGATDNKAMAMRAAVEAIVPMFEAECAIAREAALAEAEAIVHAEMSDWRGSYGGHQRGDAGWPYSIYIETDVVGACDAVLCHGIQNRDDAEQLLALCNAEIRPTIKSHNQMFAWEHA